MKHSINFFNKQRAFSPLFIILIMLWGNFLLAQSPYNLVANYSFETYVICPSNLSLGTPPPPWYRPSTNNYPIYCNACSSNPQWTVPTNTWGGISYQYAYDGNAYMGGDFLNHIGGNNRTYVQVKLNDSLENGQCYYTEFYTSLVNTSQYACNNVSVSLSKTQLWQSSNSVGVIPFNAQIYNYSNPIITDTMNWVKVSAIYIAQGGEQYLTVGNFKNDNQTNHILVDSIVNIGNPKASYYFDAIQVIPLSQEPAYANAYAGDDITINVGDSVFVGSLINGVSNIAWFNSTGQKIDSTRPGFWVKPLNNTYYVVEQTVCGNYSNDTIFITVQPLPLKFTKYELRFTNGEQVENRWQTANELNVSHFYVQRSTNVKDFNIIGKVAANGAGDNEYSFIDNSPLSTVDSRPLTYYYRIISVDKDGKTSFSEVRNIEYRTRNHELRIFPNPAKDVVTVSCRSAKTLRVINSLGQIVQQLNHATEQQIINIKQFSQGLYIVQITKANGTIETTKFIKE